MPGNCNSELVKKIADGIMGVMFLVRKLRMVMYLANELVILSYNRPLSYTHIVVQFLQCFRLAVNVLIQGLLDRLFCASRHDASVNFLTCSLFESQALLVLDASKKTRSQR
jgi:vesicle coat complex subunit